MGKGGCYKACPKEKTLEIAFVKQSQIIVPSKGLQDVFFHNVSASRQLSKIGMSNGFGLGFLM